MRAGSIVLFGMYGSVSQAVSIDLANALLFLAFAVTWTGARVFDGRKPMPLISWPGRLSGWSSPTCRASTRRSKLRFLLASGIITTYTWLTAYEFWRGRERAAGIALAGDLHAVRARFAVPAAHAACRHAAVVADQPGVRERVAHGAQLRGAAVHHLDRLHPAGDGEGAHRVPSPDRGDGRSAHRHRQPPFVPARRGRPGEAAMRPIRRPSRCC